MKKVICMLISVLLLLNTFAISTVVHATEASNNTESVSEVDEAKVKEVEEILRFLIEDAGIYDEEGYLVSYDFDLIREVYGNDPLLDELEATVALNEYLSGKNSSNRIEDRGFILDRTCVFNELTSKWGEGLKKAFVTGGVMALLQKASFNEAAKIIASKLPFATAIPVAYDLLVVANTCGTRVPLEPNYCLTNPMHSQGGCH